MKYRKKPIVIEAIQYTNSIQKIIDFVGKENMVIIEDEYFIKTLEGAMRISDNDYIIKGVNNEFYPCKPDIFVKTYDKVENE